DAPLHGPRGARGDPQPRREPRAPQGDEPRGIAVQPLPANRAFAGAAGSRRRTARRAADRDALPGHGAGGRGGRRLSDPPLSRRPPISKSPALAGRHACWMPRRAHVAEAGKDSAVPADAGLRPAVWLEAQHRDLIWCWGPPPVVAVAAGPERMGRSW